MIHQPPPVDELLARMRASTARWANLLEAHEVAWLFRPAAEEWSLTEIVCHLRDVEREVHQERFGLVLAEHVPFISGIAADNWAIERSYHRQDGPAALRAYLTLRAETLSMLEMCTEDAWLRPCRHAFLGNTTLQELVFLALSHDESHLDQAMRLVEAAAEA